MPSCRTVLAGCPHSRFPKAGAAKGDRELEGNRLLLLLRKTVKLETAKGKWTQSNPERLRLCQAEAETTNLPSRLDEAAGTAESWTVTSPPQEMGYVTRKPRGHLFFAQCDRAGAGRAVGVGGSSVSLMIKHSSM